MGWIDTQGICPAEAHIHAPSLQLGKDATKNLVKFYPLGAGKALELGPATARQELL